jgi:hypothetical protein
VVKTLILTQTPTPTEDIMEALLLQVGSRFIFGQHSRMLGIVVISILSLEAPVD